MAQFRRDGVADPGALSRALEEVEAQSLRGDYEVETLLAEAQLLLRK